MNLGAGNFGAGCFVIAVMIASPRLVSQTAPSSTPVQKMAADAHPSFAVATIKPHDPDERDRGIWVQGDHFDVSAASVEKLMKWAYSVQAEQIVGGPDWLRRDRYDINGRPDPEGEPNLAQQREMIAKLLADRFGLKFHREMRELPVYAIRVAKGGPKLAPAAHPNRKPLEQSDSHGDFDRIHNYTSAPISYLIMVEQLWSDRPLVDQTGLTGKYDFTLRYNADEVHATDPNAPPGLFTAVQQQLGLKFEPVKASVEVFVIDHVERPGEN
jgi:uncharacterized protein (TIGR03435 family)